MNLLLNLFAKGIYMYIYITPFKYGYFGYLCEILEVGVYNVCGV